jgi:hypothetical protein
MVIGMIGAACGRADDGVPSSSGATTSTSSTVEPGTTTETSGTAGPSTTERAPATSVTSAPATVPETTQPPDTTPPALDVTDPAPGARVGSARYRFAGTTEPGAAVTAAGLYPVAVDVNGAWSIVLVLRPGGNVATFEAADPAGNTTVRHVQVHYEAPLSELIVGRWAGEVTVPAGWAKIVDFSVEFRADGTYSASATGWSAFYYGSNVDEPGKTYTVHGSYPDGQPGFGTLRVTWGNPVPDPVTVGSLMDVRFSDGGDRLHFEFWREWAGRYGPVVYDLTRVGGPLDR